MAVTIFTTIQQLYDSNIISIRTYNCLKFCGYETINDVVADIKCPDDLLKIKNFGKKSLFEMVTVFTKIDGLKFGQKALSYSENKNDNLSSITLNAYNSILKQHIELKEPICKIYPSDKELHKCIFENKEKLLVVHPELSKEDNVAIRSCYKQYIEIVLNSILSDQQYEDITIVYQDALIFIDNNLNTFSDVDTLRYFTNSEIYKHLQRIYNEYCINKLSVRSRNFQAKFLPLVENIVPYFDVDIDKFYKICPGSTPTKTFQELYVFTQKFKDIYFKNLKLDLGEVKTYSFSFLLNNQKKFLLEYEQQYGHFPYWYILYKYLRVSTDRSDLIYSCLYGIYDGIERTHEDIGKYFELSAERVRQIAKYNAGVTKKTEIIDGFSNNYNSLFSLPYITEDSLEFININSIEKINVNFRIFARLITLVSDFYVEEVNGKVILLNNKNFNDFSLTRCLRTFESKLSTRYSEDTIITINQIITESSNCYSDIAKDLLIYIITKLYCFNLNENKDIIIKQNYVDVQMEIYRILENNGAPMAIEEIYTTFKNKYPDHRVDSYNDLRSYILKTEHIKAIGKQSTYALDFWENVNFSSIRDLIIEILSKSDKPVHLNDIFEYVSKHYPDTNTKNLYTTMMADDSERFVRFENSMYGLTSKKYPSNYKEAENTQRVNFDDRLTNFRAFVDTYHRFPYDSNANFEGSLARWSNRIINNIIEITPEQKAQFDEMIKSYENSGYPRNGLEYEFLNNCNDYKDFIKQQHKLPTFTTNKFLYNWFNRSKSNFNSYTDQRKQYLTDLFNFITSYGFCI